LYGNGKKARKVDTEDTKSKSTTDHSDPYFDPDCLDCLNPWTDPGMKHLPSLSSLITLDTEQLSLWLHSWEYSGKDWSYKTSLPSWAQEELSPEVT
jgi:hypothetical protein